MGDNITHRYGDGMHDASEEGKKEGCNEHEIRHRAELHDSMSDLPLGVEVFIPWLGCALANPDI